MSPERGKKGRQQEKSVDGDFLFSLNDALAAARENENLEDVLLKAANNMYGGDHGILFDFESTTGGLKAVSSFGEIEEMLSQDMRIFAQFASDHPNDPESVIIASRVKNVQKLAARKSVRRNMTKEVFLVPLSSGGECTGVIYLGSKKQGRLSLKGVTKDDALVIGNILGGVIGFKRALRRLEIQNESLLNKLEKKAAKDGLLGTSEAIQRVQRAIELVAGLDIPVTLIGEQGVRKDLLAEELHNRSGRKKKPFVRISANDVPDSIIAGVLFGETAKAGKKARKGALKDANGGTLYIENVENIPNNVQAELVKAIETGKAKPANGKKPYNTDIRLVLSTTGDPKKLVSAKKLDKSLHLKMGLYPILVPPLRDRLDDLPVLVHYFMEKSSSMFGKKLAGVQADVYDYLGSWEWKENLSELEKEIRHAVLRTPDKRGVIGAASLNPYLVGQKQPVVTDPGEGTLKQRVARIEKRLIIDSLEKNKHNQSTTADQLGLSRQALINKLHRYGIETGRKYKRKMRELAAQAEQSE